jgi:recombination protein RecA
MPVPETIEEIIASTNKKAKRQVLFHGSELKRLTYARCTTGCLSFDLMLGGGWPMNGINEIVGYESMGKTTISMKTVAAQQALNPDHHTVWVAAEDFDFAYAMQLGVDADRMTFVSTNVMEEAYESCDRVLKARACDAVIIDSLPALMPSEEDDKTMMESTVGRSALLTNKFMRKVLYSSGRSMVEHDRNVLVLLINQWRERVGVMYGDPRTTPGGRGKNYTFLTRVDVTRDEWLKEGDRLVGQTIKAQTIKNKTHPPRRIGTVDYYFDHSDPFQPGEYDLTRDVWDVAIETGVIERKGAWYHFKSKRWNGKEAVWKDMKADPKLVAALDTEVRREVLGIEPPPAASSRKRTVNRK